MRPPQTETVDGKENTMTDAERERIMAIIRDEASMADAVSKLEWRKKAVGGLPAETDILLRTCEAVKDILGVIIKMKTPKKREEVQAMKEIDIIRDKLSTEELLCQLAEECVELSKAALKLRRVLTKANPTPVSPSEAYENMWEEIFDVTFVLEVLAFDLNSPIIQEFREAKPERWVRRLEGKDA